MSDDTTADVVARAVADHAAGRIANPDQLARVTSSTVTDGPAAGCRIIDVQTCGGWSVRILPDRGLDLGPVDYAGVPLSWTSAVGPAGPLERPSADAWLQAFSGGLLTTCGLQNVGAPSEGHGLHGRYSHLRADRVAVDRRVLGDTVTVEIAATMDEVEALGAHLRLERRVRIDAGSSSIEVQDVTTNLSDEAVAAPLLYHINLGAPFWSGDARLRVTSSGVEPRDAEAAAGVTAWDRPPPVAAGASEWVLEHHPVSDADGWAHAEVTSPALDVRMRCSWETAHLPRLHQWSHRRAGVYALAVEPANCSTLGRAADRAAGQLPSLAPGERRSTRLRFVAGRL